MPQQETFLELQTPDGSLVMVVKTYDQQFARGVFEEINDEAKDLLRKSLKIEDNHDTVFLLSADEPEDRDAFLLDELVDAGRDVWPNFSYFVVVKTLKGTSEHLYVSSDWPSAEEYVKTHFQIPAISTARPAPTVSSS